MGVERDMIVSAGVVAVEKGNVKADLISCDQPFSRRINIEPYATIICDEHPLDGMTSKIATHLIVGSFCPFFPT